MLRLPLEVAPLFRDWLAAHYPLRAAHVMSIVQQIRGGRDNDPRFGARMGGQGEFADLIRKRFAIACKRLGLNSERDRAARHDAVSGRPRDSSGQLDLFADNAAPRLARRRRDDHSIQRGAMATLTERLARCYTGAVHDVLRMMGHENIVLPPAIKAIAPGTKLAGPVWTVVRAHRSHEDAARDAARLVHAAREGACRPRRRLPAATTTRSR